MELYFNGVRMPLSRFPNRGYMTMKRVLNNAGGITNQNWDGANWEKVAPGSAGGTFEFREEFAAQHASWAEGFGSRRLAERLLAHSVGERGHPRPRH